LKIADAHKRFPASVNASYSTRRDGTHKYQSVWKAVWLDRLGNEVEVEIVVDTIFAAWVHVDEIHSAGATTAQTYTHIIDPFNTLVRDPQLRPSYTAITGSALANGVVTVLSFALKAY
jgi:predicted signal transduction protein with EAL and GGDEF domain